MRLRRKAGRPVNRGSGPVVGAARSRYRIIHDPDLSDARRADEWHQDDLRSVAPLGMVQVGALRNKRSLEAGTHDEMSPAVHTQSALHADMDLNHVEAALAFPTFTRFWGQTLLKREDNELALLCVEGLQRSVIAAFGLVDDEPMWMLTTEPVSRRPAAAGPSSGVDAGQPEVGRALGERDGVCALLRATVGLRHGLRHQRGSRRCVRRPGLRVVAADIEARGRVPARRGGPGLGGRRARSRVGGVRPAGWTCCAPTAGVPPPFRPLREHTQSDWDWLLGVNPLDATLAAVGSAVGAPTLSVGRTATRSGSPLSRAGTQLSTADHRTNPTAGSGPPRRVAATALAALDARTLLAFTAPAGAGGK